MIGRFCEYKICLILMDNLINLVIFYLVLMLLMLRVEMLEILLKF